MREIKLYLTFIDVLVWQFFLYSSFSAMNVVGKGVFLFVFVLRLVFDYAIIFFLWSNRRVEEYGQTYEPNGTLEFFAAFLVQNGINILYVVGVVSKKYAFIALAIYIFCFSWGRAKGHFGSNGDYWDAQFKADAGTLLMLECLNMFCVLGLLTVVPFVQKLIIFVIIIAVINISSSMLTYKKRRKFLAERERYIWYEVLCVAFYACEITAGYLYMKSDNVVILIFWVLVQMLLYTGILKWGADAYRAEM